MKKIISLVFSLIIIFSLSGCYTVAWQPGEDLPVKEDVSFKNSNYYNINDFGVFSYYYNSAWWLNTDNNFLLNNLTTVRNFDENMTDINIVPLEPIAGPGCPTVPPSIPLPIVSPIGKPNTIASIKSQQTKNNTSNKNVRNNNGSRNTSKGKGR